MEFRDYLKKDLERIGCSLSELSRASGLSSAVISRYRSGERIPRADSDMLVKLCRGLAELEERAGLTPVGEERLLRYRTAIDNKPSLLSEHLDFLLKTLKISMKDLSYILNYDASYLSRIRSGKRTPADPVAFADHVAKALNETLRPADRAVVYEMTGSTPDDDFVEALSGWLVQTTPAEDASVGQFLNSIDSFSLNQFIRSIAISSPVLTGKPIGEETRYYYNTEGLRQGELDFFMTTLQSKSTGPIYMCNDMPMEEMAKDISFVKQWMEVIAQCLKKGHRIHIIHDVNRSFAEMMLGLETWIPVYMTGQLEPYYLPSSGSSVYHHSLYVSDACVLMGEGIGSTTENAASALSGIPERIEYGKNRAKHLFSHSSPLMRIIRSPQNEAQIKFMKTESVVPGAWHIRSCVPPFCTLSSDLLEEILQANNADDALVSRAQEYLVEQQNFMKNLLQNGTAAIEVMSFTRTEFNRYTPEFDAPFMGTDEYLRYTWDTYQKHLKLSKIYAAEHAGLSIKESKDNAFRNLSIYVRDQKFAIVTRQKDPRIIFVITHPNMVRSLRQFTAPVIESEN